MVVDIAPQQQLNEVFTTKHSHHRSSSAHRQTSSTTNTTSASASSSSSMTNGTRIVTNELGKKAEQILGFATAFLDSPRETMLDFAHYPQRLNITASESNTPSRSATFSTVSPTAAHMPSTRGSSSSSVKTAASHDTSGKKRRVVTATQLVPLIFQVVATPTFVKLPATISRRQSNARGTNNIMSSRELALVLHRESDVKLSDDENDDEEEDEDNDGDDHEDSTNPVLMETIDNNIKNNSFNQINSNDNAPAPLSIPAPHRYENQIELEHSGRSSSRCQEDDSEDDDSDNQEAAHSDAENDDQTNSTNPNTLSLMDFISGKEPFSEPADSSLKQHSPESLTTMKKRSISPEIKRDNTDLVHNADDHQNKRKKILIKRALLKCFISSVNTKIDIKRPSLPITIPTHLFFDRSPSADSTKHDGESLIERSQRTSKRYANGTLKHDTNTDVPDGLSHLPTHPPSSLSNQTSSTPNGIHQKKNKTSHAQEKPAFIKHEPPTLSSTSTKNESNSSCNINSSTETDSKVRPTQVATTTATTTVNPLIAIPPKKEKPTANVRPLQQTTTIDGLSTGNFINNSANTSDGLTTNGMRSNLPSTKSNYLKLKNMSKADLASLARKKKKQADYGKRTTLEEIREAMGLYLESVCYYIQCAIDEPKPDQRTELLITTLNMLQQLASNHQKMFCLSNRSVDLLCRIRQKFLLINYWLQSFIHHLQYNTNIPTIDQCASQVTDYFHSSKGSSTRTTMTNNQPQLTPMNDNNPISPLSTASQTSSSDVSTASATNQVEQHRYIYDFSKLMLNAYQSTNYWTKADRLMREKSLKEFSEQLMKQNQNRRLSRDDTTLDFLLYIFDAIELLRLSVA